MPIASATAQPHANEIPNLMLTALEIPRVLGEMSWLPLASGFLNNRPQGDGQPVVVLPGFSAGDRTTTILRKHIQRWGYDSRPWGLGMNMNPKELKSFEDVMAAKAKLVHEMELKLSAIKRETGQKTSLIGWSLGGVMARLIASHFPDLVRQIITLGTPFGDPRSVVVYPLMEKLRKQPINEDHLAQWMEMSDAPLGDVPLSIIYSKTDGFVAPHAAVKPASATVENIHVMSSHVGFTVNPMVLYLVADRLAQSDDNWSQFKAQGIGRALFKTH